MMAYRSENACYLFCLVLVAVSGLVSRVLLHVYSIFIGIGMVLLGGGSLVYFYTTVKRLDL